MEEERCVEMSVDGDQVRVRWSGGAMKPEDVAALTALVRAVRKEAGNDDEDLLDQR
jgi:hypothetical protein